MARQQSAVHSGRLVANGLPQPVFGSNGLKLKQEEKKISDSASAMRQIEAADVG
jgi:hypothetical protein